MSQVLNLSAGAFPRLADLSQPVLTDFWAASVDDRAVVAKVDVDDEPELASRFGVSGIPTLVVMKQGQVVRRMVGVQPANLLAAALQTAGA